MKIYFAEKMKTLRQERGISQEKLAQYLGVSPQAVSKWENEFAMPDITLLPELANYFGVTIDELLEVEKIDEAKLFEEYRCRAADCSNRGEREELISLWQEAQHKMPNHLKVKEMLLSSYFDTDKIKYKDEIVELGTELYRATEGGGEDNAYLRGQAISIVARTYAACGDTKRAEQWATKASYLLHAQEFIMTEITHGKDLLSYFRYANDWYFNNLFYMACRIAEDMDISDNAEPLFDTVIALYEMVYPLDDMSFEMLEKLCYLYCRTAVCKAGHGDQEKTMHCLTRAAQCAAKATKVKAHALPHPLVFGRMVEDAPTNNNRLFHTITDTFAAPAFDLFREEAWFQNILK